MVFAVISSLRLVHYLSNDILGLSSSWGTSRIRPAWSPCEHQLTPALSPIWGPHPKPRHPEEVVYSPNDSCSHFTQCLFPPKLSQQHTCTILAYVHRHSYLLYTTFKQCLHPFITRQSFYHFFGSSWQAYCSRSLVSDTITLNEECVFQLFNIGRCVWHNQHNYVHQPCFFFCLIGKDQLYVVIMYGWGTDRWPEILSA